MNLPNKLTVLRMVMIPVFLFFFFAEWVPQNFLWALLVFALASLTDLLDGKIARARGLVTDFGKLMDPLADKLLVMAAMLCLTWIGAVHVVVVFVILAREFLVTSIRTVAASKGRIMAADILGKAKTVAQMIWLLYALVWIWMAVNLEVIRTASLSNSLWIVQNVLVGIVVGLTLLSGMNYAWQARDLFADK